MNSVKVARGKINVQKSELSKKTKKTIPLTIASKKHLRINLTNEAKNVYSENYKTLKKEIEEDTNKWKHIMC